MVPAELPAASGLRGALVDRVGRRGVRARPPAGVRPPVRARRVDHRSRLERRVLAAPLDLGTASEGVARHARRHRARGRRPGVPGPDSRRVARTRVPADPGRAAMTLRDEAVELLQALIRLDTVNPPGNETAAAELLRAYLEPHGVECELYARVPERANLVARIRGRGEGPSLLLLSHTDTVLADPTEWSVDPWSGALKDGQVWGRGALDMKDQVAANAVAIASLARDGFEPAGDLIFAATADEEVGEGFGLSWLCEEHPDAVRCDYAVNEGAGDRLELGGRPFYICSTAEKMSAPFRIRVHGRAGHASMPGIADNALVKAASLIERIASYRPQPRIEQEVEAFLRAVLGDDPSPEEIVSRAHGVDRTAAERVEPLLAPTFAPTMISASRKRNISPSVCEITVDCRLLPGQR